MMGEGRSRRGQGPGQHHFQAGSFGPESQTPGVKSRAACSVHTGVQSARPSPLAFSWLLPSFNAWFWFPKVIGKMRSFLGLLFPYDLRKQAFSLYENCLGRKRRGWS